MINHYQVLGAHAQMEDLEIRELYRKAARANHPDRGGDANTFAAVTAAYAAVGTASARTRTRSLYALACPPCAACSGTGAARSQRGFTGVLLRPCAACGGCGYVLAPVATKRGRKK